MIKLITVIGHGSNLLPHFIKHYENKVEEIKIVIYVSDLCPTIENEVREIVKGYNRIEIVDVINGFAHDWDLVTQMYNQVTSKFPDDWWVIADIDEFHLYSTPLYHIIANCEHNDWKIVRGGFIDRIGNDGELAELMPDQSIFSQYPNAGFFRHPMSYACPNKICIIKGGIKLTSGQHYAEINGHTTWRWQGWNHPLIAPYDKFSVQVHHFKWDSTAIYRLAKAGNNESDPFSCEYKLMYDQIVNDSGHIDTNNKEYMFERCIYGEFDEYKQWNKLLKKIISI